MTGGFAQAFARLEAARAAEDAEAAFYALFESLDWAHAVDEYVARSWRPDGRVEGDPPRLKPLEHDLPPWWEWRRHPALGIGDTLWDIMQGLRYARNRIHHQWADALVTTDGRTYPRVYPMRFRSWVWRDVEQLPTPSNASKEAPGHKAYTKALAGRPAHHTLAAIGETFTFLGSLLDPPIPVRTPPVVVTG
jgi:hypothetical protein